MTAVPQPDAVVFDNDGLLLDTESVWTRAEQDLFDRRGSALHAGAGGAWECPGVSNLRRLDKPRFAP